MVGKIRGWLGRALRNIVSFPEYAESPERYRLLRRNLIVLGILGTTIPLTLMAVINHYQYQKALKDEIVQPLRLLVNKTKHSFELFLAERRSAVSFIANAYSYEELADEKRLNSIFQVMKQEFGGFVDLGLIDATGLQVSYTGPYKLKGKNYSEQSWFQEVRVRGTYISDVFMGYRKFPHFVIAVERTQENGKTWFLRTTIDTEIFNNLIASMGLEPSADAFILNREGVFQTPSKFYGKVLEKMPLSMPPPSQQPNILEVEDNRDREVLMAYTYFENPNFVLAVLKPKSEVLKAWYTLKSEIFYLFVISVIVIVIGSYTLTDLMVKRIEESDKRREAAFKEMEHTSKLASIGRLAAGVAHEINNPLAIISEKSGLMEDLITYRKHCDNTEKFLELTRSIEKSVERCKTITRRLLGFARRMDVKIEVLDVNEVLREVLGFMEQEALYRKIELRLNLAEDLPSVPSDRGQLQQLFLNILNNAFAAVEDEGVVSLKSWDNGDGRLGVLIEDNGCGMSAETVKRIFEPFYTTKKGEGTGLGLSISYGIIKKLGGDIEVESKEGEGSTFKVYLPKKSEEAAA